MTGSSVFVLSGIVQVGPALAFEQLVTVVGIQDPHSGNLGMVQVFREPPIFPYPNTGCSCAVFNRSS